MLNSRYAAAPVRRSNPKRSLAVVIAMVLAITAWAGTRVTGGTQETPENPSSNAPPETGAQARVYATGTGACQTD